jgi:hypothetical protein
MYDEIVSRRSPFEATRWDSYRTQPVTIAGLKTSDANVNNVDTTAIVMLARDTEKRLSQNFYSIVAQVVWLCRDSR